MKSTINSDEAPGIHQIAINERSGGSAFSSISPNEIEAS